MRRRWIERRSIGVASIMRGLPSREVHSKCSVLSRLSQPNMEKKPIGFCQNPHKLKKTKYNTHNKCFLLLFEVKILCQKK
jgi:hypothetical protein